MDRDNNVDPDNMVKAKPRVSNIDDKELNAFRLWKEEKEQRVETRRKGSRKNSFSKSNNHFFASASLSLHKGKTINHLHKFNLSSI